jgi:hypothetical protein
MGIRGARRGSRSEADELAVYREFVRRLTETCEAAARGDLEARSRPAPEAGEVPELRGLHHALNRVLDVSDAFVRESSAALTSAAEGRFHRRLLQGGLHGAFRKSASDINAARGAM